MPAVTEDNQLASAELFSRLRASEELYARAFMTSPVAMSITDVKSQRFTHINLAFSALVGYARAEVLGRTSQDLGFWRGSDARATVSERLPRVENLPLRRGEIRVKDGRLVPVLAGFSLVEVAEVESVLSVLVPLPE